MPKDLDIKAIKAINDDDQMATFEGRADSTGMQARMRDAARQIIEHVKYEEEAIGQRQAAIGFGGFLASLVIGYSDRFIAQHAMESRELVLQVMNECMKQIDKTIGGSNAEH